MTSCSRTLRSRGPSPGCWSRTWIRTAGPTWSPPRRAASRWPCGTPPSGQPRPRRRSRSSRWPPASSGGARPPPPISTWTACPTWSAWPRRATPRGQGGPHRPGPATRASGSARGSCPWRWRLPVSRAWLAGGPGRRPAARPAPRPRRRGPPAVARNLGNGHHWLALQLGGHWRVKPELMRTNSHAIGTRVIVEGQGLHVSHDHTTPESGLAQSIGPVVLGLGHDADRRPGPPALARRRDAVRAERGRRRAARARREQPQDRKLPGPFHVERRAIRLPRRLPGRRRAGLPGGAGRLQPARPRRGRGHRRRPAPRGAGGLPPLDHRADGRGRLSGCPDPRRRGSAAGRLGHPRRAIRPRRPPAHRRAAGLATGHRAGASDRPRGPRRDRRP